MYLSLDLHNFRNKAVFALLSSTEIKSSCLSKVSVDTFLVALEKFLRSHKITLSEIEGFIVVSGKTGFTNTRLSVIYGNLFSYLFQKKVVEMELALETESFTHYKKNIFPKMLKEVAEKFKQTSLRTYLVPHYIATPNIRPSKKSI